MGLLTDVVAKKYISMGLGNRAIIILFLFVISSTRVSAEYLKTYVEFNGGYGTVAMEEENKLEDEIIKGIIGYGLIPDYHKTKDTGIFNVVINNTFNSPLGIIGICFRYDYLSLFVNNDYAYYSSGQLAGSTTAIIRPSYFGMGLKYFIENKVGDFLKINPYLGIDAGIFMTYGNANSKNYFETGDVYFEEKKDFEMEQSQFWGGNVEIGNEVWFGEIFGLNVKGGYRYADGFINYKFTKHTDPAKLNTEQHIIVDYSGFYISVGLLVAVWR